MYGHRSAALGVPRSLLGRGRARGLANAHEGTVLLKNRVRRPAPRSPATGSRSDQAPSRQRSRRARATTPP
ncbi:hypothetical protein C791_7871 [Amycolatopsis azurea DSM 43854]|uniref:Uncharacterized protein n=1 Tax=Amycolatopsis azurea DSM 43854 TaxID=1238180 RepID=M2Q848_9PSEU|nr:hypothetical protein C791_7871 [Amycolatopsis azurea DSM 43854]